MLLAATSAALVFGVNAVSFLAVLGAVAGGRYVADSPALLSLIARAVAFIFPAGALWALLPLVARHRLGLGSAGYGLLLGCAGLGALLAATLGPG